MARLCRAIAGGYLLSAATATATAAVRNEPRPFPWRTLLARDRASRRGAAPGLAWRARCARARMCPLRARTPMANEQKKPGTLKKGFRLFMLIVLVLLVPIVM